MIKKKNIGIKSTEEDVNRIDEAAKKTMQSRSQFMMYASIKRANEVLENANS